MGKVATIDDWDSNAYDVGSYMQNYCVNQILSDCIFDDDIDILDLGCGDGKNTTNILNYVPTATILGIDHSPQMVASAQANYSKGSISFKQKDITHLDFNEKFDLVVSFFCLDWIKDQLALQQKIYRALKPRGQSLFVISTGKDDVAKIVETVASSDKWGPYLKGYTIPAGLHEPKDYRTFMQQAGHIIDGLDVIQIPVELPNISVFHKFISALPLFGDVLTEKQNNEIATDITKAFKNLCVTKYDSKLICIGEMIVVKAHRAP